MLMSKHRFALTLLAVLGLTAHFPLRAAENDVVFVEAEMFARKGGWVVDPQFMDLMGSPYLLAHGLGRPVADATTEAAIPSEGSYRVWVRTKDWVAQWKAPGTPGRFQVLVNGKPLGTVFGTEGAQWHWQDGGTIALPAGNVSLALHDLTGFEGRCDAIVLARDPNFTPPNREPEMGRFRRACLGLPEEPVPAGSFDLVVSGGGIAGTCAALAAARQGLSVALVQDRPVLGGNNSSEVRVWLQGGRNKKPWPRVGDIVAELEPKRRAHYGPENTADIYEDDKKLAIVRAEPRIRLFLEHRVNGAETRDGRIQSITAQSIITGQRIRLAGRWFADCTGDASVGALAGADFAMEPKNHMGPCNLWNVCECKDTNAINTDASAGSQPVAFPRCPWALDLSDKPFPGRDKIKPDPSKLGGWYWESGFDRDPIEEMEYVRDWNFRAMYGAWDALKNVDKVLPNHQLNWAAFILGKRESRRLLGDVVLSLDDLKSDRQFPDACVPTGWSNDLHVPDPKFNQGFAGDAFISTAQFGKFPALEEGRPFWIPYRCLYSRNIANLLMAGRNISVDHDAMGAVRVMRTCGCEGEILGMAASLCKKHDIQPRNVYQQYLHELQELMKHGAGKDPSAVHAPEPPDRPVRRAPRIDPPAWLKTAGINLARSARVESPASPPEPANSVARLNDGQGNLGENGQRWLGRGRLPHVVTFTWPQPVTLGAVRVISGYFHDGVVSDPIADFSWQYQEDGAWKDLPALRVEGNEDPAWSRRFDAITTRAVRLSIHKTKGQISRVWEVEFYPPPGP